MDFLSDEEIHLFLLIRASQVWNSRYQYCSIIRNCVVLKRNIMETQDFFENNIKIIEADELFDGKAYKIVFFIIFDVWQ